MKLLSKDDLSVLLQSALDAAEIWQATDGGTKSAAAHAEGPFLKLTLSDRARRELARVLILLQCEKLMTHSARGQLDE